MRTRIIYIENKRGENTATAGNLFGECQTIVTPCEENKTNKLNCRDRIWLKPKMIIDFFYPPAKAGGKRWRQLMEAKDE